MVRVRAEPDAAEIHRKLKERIDKGGDVKLDPVYKELVAKVGEGESGYMQRILARLANLEQAD